MERYEVVLNNTPGALAHVVALVAGRRWTLASLHFPAAESPDRRSLFLELQTGARDGQVEAQVSKLYDVLTVRRMP